MLTVQTSHGDEFVLVIELLREPDEVKRNWWPRYLTGLYAHHKVPIVLAVLCHDDVTADWAARPIVVGTDFWTSLEVRPLVLGPRDLPLPEGPICEAELPLAVLGVITHGDDPRVGRVLEEVAVALKAVDAAVRDQFSSMISRALREPSAVEKWGELAAMNIDL